MNNDMRASLWRIHLVAGSAAVGGYFLLPDDWWQTGVGAAVALAGPAGLLVGVWLHRPRRRRLWWTFAAGLSCIAAGDFVYALYERVLHDAAPFPSLADALYLAGCPLIGAAWWGWYAPGRPAGTGSAGSTRPSWRAGWSALVGVPDGADRHQQRPHLVGRLVALAYPVWDVLFLALLVRLLAGLGARLPALRLLAGACALCSPTTPCMPWCCSTGPTTRGSSSRFPGCWGSCCSGPPVSIRPWPS